MLLQRVLLGIGPQTYPRSAASGTCGALGTGESKKE